MKNMFRSFLVSALLLSSTAAMANNVGLGSSASQATSKTEELILSQENVIVLNSDFNALSVGKVIQDARNLDSKLPNNHPIILVINSPGGSIEAGLVLIDSLRALNRPVHTLTLTGYSMGFQTMQALGTRYVTDFSKLMSHKASGGFSGEFGDGNSQLDSRYSFYLRRLKKLDEDVVSRTGGKYTLEKYRAAFTPELWLSGFEAQSHGFADKLVNVKCDATLTGTTEQEINTIFGALIVEFSKCPVSLLPINVRINIYTDSGEMVEMSKFIASGGKFGRDCKDRQETSSSSSAYSKYSSSYDSDNESEEAPCTKNPDLTKQQVDELVQKETAKIYEKYSKLEPIKYNL